MSATGTFDTPDRNLPVTVWVPDEDPHAMPRPHRLNTIGIVGLLVGLISVLLLCGLVIYLLLLQRRCRLAELQTATGGTAGRFSLVNGFKSGSRRQSQGRPRGGLSRSSRSSGEAAEREFKTAIPSAWVYDQSARVSLQGPAMGIAVASRTSSKEGQSPPSSPSRSSFSHTNSPPLSPLEAAFTKVGRVSLPPRRRASVVLPSAGGNARLRDLSYDSWDAGEPTLRGDELALSLSQLPIGYVLAETRITHSTPVFSLPPRSPRSPRPRMALRLPPPLPLPTPTSMQMQMQSHLGHLSRPTSSFLPPRPAFHREISEAQSTISMPRTVSRGSSFVEIEIEEEDAESRVEMEGDEDGSSSPSLRGTSVVRCGKGTPWGGETREPGRMNAQEVEAHPSSLTSTSISTFIQSTSTSTSTSFPASPSALSALSDVTRTGDASPRPGADADSSTATVGAHTSSQGSTLRVSQVAATSATATTHSLAPSHPSLTSPPSPIPGPVPSSTSTSSPSLEPESEALGTAFRDAFMLDLGNGRGIPLGVMKTPRPCRKEGAIDSYFAPRTGGWV